MKMNAASANVQQVQKATKRVDKSVSHRMGVQSGAGQPKNYIPIYRYAQEQESINAGLNGSLYKNFVEGLTRIVLPGDGRNPHNRQVERLQEFRRQASTQRFSHFMQVANQADRMNNPSQYAAMHQKQRGGPNSTAQFTAFMRAMQASFGTLQ